LLIDDCLCSTCSSSSSSSSRTGAEAA
jgi:hypothetical protein